MLSDTRVLQSKSSKDGSWELREDPTKNIVGVVFRGYLARDDGRDAAEAFVTVLQRGPAVVVWDVREMRGYDSGAMGAWAARLKPLRKNIQRVRLVGGNGVVRTGARVIGSILEVAVIVDDDDATPFKSAAVEEHYKTEKPAPAPSPLRFLPLHSSDEMVVAALGRFVVVDTPKMPSPRSMTAMGDIFRQHSDLQGRTIGVVNVMTTRIGRSVSAESRRSAQLLSLNMGKYVGCHALLLVGDGLFTTWARGLVTGLNLIARPPFPTLTCSTASQAAEFVTERLGAPTDAPRIVQLIEQTMQRADALG